MQDKKLTLYYFLRHPVLNGVATLSINEYSHVLSEKSLYGAGTTRHFSTVSLTYEVGNESIEILTNKTQDTQNILKDDYDKEAVDYIHAAISSFMFETVDMLTEELENR